MNGHHEIHIFKYILDKKELNELYVSIIFRTLAFSMIGIFVPLFLFVELNYSLNFIILYYLIYSLTFLVFTPVGAKLISKIGFKHVILISIPIYVFYFVLLYLLETNPFLFVFVPAFIGLADALYWIAFHTDFSIFSQKNKRGKQVGTWYTLSLLTGLVGPMIGGIVLTFSDFNILFSIVSVLLFGSAIPLFLSKDTKTEYDFSWSFLKAGSIRDFLSFVAIGVKNMVESVFWPIFIFTILGFLYVSMGSLFTVLSGVNLIVTYIASKLADKFNKRKLIKWFAIPNSFVWLIMMFVRTKLELFGATFLANFTIIGADLPYMALTYNKTRKRIDYLIFREMGLCIGRILVLILVLLSGSLLSSFFYAAFASLGYILL